MKPVSPVIPGTGLPEVKVAEHQPEYGTLPVVYSQDGQECTSRWVLSDEEIADIVKSKSIFLTLQTFGRPLQPVRMEVGRGRMHDKELPVLMPDEWERAAEPVPPHMPMHCRRCGSEFMGCDCPDAAHALQYGSEVKGVIACRDCAGLIDSTSLPAS